MFCWSASSSCFCTGVCFFGLLGQFLVPVALVVLLELPVFILSSSYLHVIYLHLIKNLRRLNSKALLNQVHATWHACLISWNCFGLQVSMCVCVCVPTPKSINNQWCDMVWYRPLCNCLSKFHGFFPAFNYFIWHLPSIKWMGLAILTQHIVNACQKTPRWHGTSYKRTTGKMGHFIYKREWANA